MGPVILQRGILDARGRFYSWQYIMRRLAKCDLHYAAVGLYGKSVVKRTSKEVDAYLGDIRKAVPAAVS